MNIIRRNLNQIIVSSVVLLFIMNNPSGKFFKNLPSINITDISIHNPLKGIKIPEFGKQANRDEIIEIKPSAVCNNSVRMKINGPTKSFSKDSTTEEIIYFCGQKHGVDPLLITAMIHQESRGNKKAVSPKGAEGLMQLMPDTQKELGVTDPFDPAQNIEAGTKYIAWLLDRYEGSLDLALAGYNAGPGAVDKYGGIPPFNETENYVRIITNHYDRLKKQADESKEREEGA